MLSSHTCVMKAMMLASQPTRQQPILANAQPLIQTQIQSLDKLT